MKQLDLLFIGDSITEYWLSDGREVWEFEFAEWEKGNEGISGDTTTGVLGRLDDIDFELLRPRLIVLLIGTNDIGMGFPSESIAEGIERIVNRLLALSGTSKILLLGIFPRNRGSNCPDRKTVRAINTRISALAEKEKVIFLDLEEQFLDSEDYLRIELMPDYLHLSQKGYWVWAEAMKPKLNELLAR